MTQQMEGAIAVQVGSQFVRLSLGIMHLTLCCQTSVGWKPHKLPAVNFQVENPVNPSLRAIPAHHHLRLRKDFSGDRRS